jgi:GTPase SAR1 family protein
MLQKKPDYTAKIVIIGNTNVGKTQLASSICNKQLNNNSTTIGTDILKHLITT